MKSSDLIKLLKQAGFEFVSSRGSHHKFRNKENVTVIVPHPKKQLPLGTYRSILKQAGLS